MVTKTDEETRQALLQELRKLVCFQTRLWDTCAEIDDILGGEFDSLATVMKIAAVYAGKELGERDADAILVEMLAVPAVRRVRPDRSTLLWSNDTLLLGN